MDNLNIIKNSKINLSKALLVLGITLYMLYYIFSLSDWHFIDNVNLIFHEAGHVIFIFFGDLIRSLGGTLMQVIVPSIFSYYFYANEDYFSASLLLFWLSQNFFNISVYVGDAINMDLPLLGGASVYHDWNHIFSSLNILNQTDKFESGIYFMGIIVFIFAVIFSFKYSLKEN